jgi:hypothetical protein
MTRSTICRAVVSCAVVLGAVCVAAQIGPAQQSSTLTIDWPRSYKAGDVLVYEMDGSNQGWKYQL